MRDAFPLFFVRRKLDELSINPDDAHTWCNSFWQKHYPLSNLNIPSADACAAVKDATRNASSCSSKKSTKSLYITHKLIYEVIILMKVINWANGWGGIHYVKKSNIGPLPYCLLCNYKLLSHVWKLTNASWHCHLESYGLLCHEFLLFFTTNRHSKYDKFLLFHCYFDQLRSVL